jgi:hypothetical protein
MSGIHSVKTLGLQHLQLLDMALSSILPDGVFIVHHRTDELHVEQHTISDGQATSPIKERSKHAQLSSCLSSYLLDVHHPGQTQDTMLFGSLY